MSISKPSEFARWADNGGTIVEPSEGKKNTGYIVEKPTLGGINWLFNTNYNWARYLYASFRRLLCLAFSQKTAGSQVFWSIDVDPSGNMVAVGAAGSLWLSTDGGETWESKTSGTGYSLYKVRHNQLTGGSGLWVAIGQDSVICTSSDGSTWVANVGPFSISSDSYTNALTFGNGKWIISGVLTGGSQIGLAWSSDAITWHLVSNPFGTGAGSSIFSAVWNPIAAKYFITGQSTIASSPDGATWTVLKAYNGATSGQYLSINCDPNGIMVIYGTAGSSGDAFNLYVTTDGVTFSTKLLLAAPATNYSQDLVIIDNFGMWTVVAANYIIHSLDAANWVIEQICASSNSIHAVAYNPVFKNWCFAGSDHYIYRSHREL